MRARLCAALATAAVGVAVLPVYAGSGPAAAGPAPQITDPSGDANGLNDQGLGLGDLPVTTTPVNDGAADITGLTFQTTYKTVTSTQTVIVTTKKNGKVVKIKKTVTTTTQVPTGATLTETLAAAPDTNTFYAIRFTSTAASCKSVELIYDASPAPVYAQNDGRCQDGGTTASTIAGPVSTISGSTIVWTLPLSAFPVGSTFSAISAQTLPGAVPAGNIDRTADSTFSFTVGK
ncbi:MAG: hypothetical protein JO079_07375 [Frankiaceae bacterium]|nr:hypothetical protein [Frankiaceae bacterium]MBV9368452.1 hypothetical protein [Frankiales bacterium]